MSLTQEGWRRMARFRLMAHYFRGRKLSVLKHNILMNIARPV
jgi:hypothetical protein